jgi:hypothetical protein
MGLGLALITRGLAAGFGGPLEEPLILTQVPRSATAATATRETRDLVRGDWFNGARVVVVTPSGPPRVLSGGFHSAADPNVSFDGRRVLFAGRKDSGSRWRIWEIGVDGQGLRAVSPEHLDARSPIHVSTLFTLDSPEPWFTMVFVGHQTTLNEQGRAGISSLFNLRLDGTELRRLTFNPNANFDPFQMWDGRVIYSAERYPNQPGGAAGHVGLYAIHVEGADMEFYGGARGGRIQHMPCATDRGLVVFVEPEPGSRDGAGQLACVEEQRPHVTYRALSKDRSFVFLHPSPLQGNRLLVSRRPAKGKATCGVFCFDTDSGRCEPVFDSPDYHEVQAVVLRPRKRPDGHSTVIDTKFDSGIFYGLNAYDADARMAPHLSTGMVKRVRFIEGVLPTGASAPKPVAVKGPSMPRRLVGEAPVEADGSFNVEVPANTPLLLQTLDERGLALANCGWIWVQPKEKRGCIGCHEDPERVPENEYVLALRRPSNRLVLPPNQRRSISFRQDIAPLLQKHCATADCHGGKDTPVVLPLTAERPTERDLEAAYAALLTPARGKAKPAAEWPQPGKYVDAGRARTSRLIWHLTGSDTSRPWDRDGEARARPHRKPLGRSDTSRPWDRDGEAAATQPREVKRMPPAPHGDPLNAEALRTVIQWIDLGAQYESPAAPAEPKRTP